MFGRKYKYDINNAFKIIEEQNQRMDNLKNKLSLLQLDFERIKTHIQSLRGLVNRKLSGSQSFPVNERVKYDDGLDSLRENA